MYLPVMERCLKMFYDEVQALQACEEAPSLIFQLMKEGHFELVDEFLQKKIVPLSTADEHENTVIMQLLRYKQYDLVLKYMKKEEADINHQNDDGNTFAHFLVAKDYVHVAKIIKELNKNKAFIPNIKNFEGKTILDLSIEKNYFCTTVHILKDKRFDNIDILSFQNLYQTYIKSNLYGKYTKLTNLELIVGNLGKKDSLLPRLQKLVDHINEEMDNIKEEILTNRMTLLDGMIKEAFQEGI